MVRHTLSIFLALFIVACGGGGGGGGGGSTPEVTSTRTVPQQTPEEQEPQLTAEEREQARLAADEAARVAAAAAEAARQAADEAARVAADEAARLAADEAARQAAAAAEAARQAADEAARVAAELAAEQEARTAAEDARIAAEAARLEAERQRIAAEQAQLAADEAAQLADQTQTAPAARLEADLQTEAARLAEQARLAAEEAARLAQAAGLGAEQQAEATQLAEQAQLAANEATQLAQAARLEAEEAERLAAEEAARIQQLQVLGEVSTYEAALLGLQNTGNSFEINQVTNLLGGTLVIIGDDANPPSAAELLDDGYFIATLDTGAQDAWRLGWTGKGVKIGIADQFEGDPRTPIFRDLLNTVLRSHGASVAFVARQVAPEATIGVRNIRFGCTSGAEAAQDIANAFRAFETQGHHIVNNSWSSSRFSRGVCDGDDPSLYSQADWDRFIANNIRTNSSFRSLALPTGSTESYDPNMLFVFAAGNDGRSDHCPLGTGDCNLYASSILKLREDGAENAGDRVMFVGSLADNLADDGSSQLAVYSQTAGRMMHDYIVAHDDIFVKGHGAGTSFATPRVVGAAALVRHKFPNLTGPNLKLVLLQTATDLGVTGVDEVFGYGELNVLGALSPVGALVSE